MKAEKGKIIMYFMSRNFNRLKIGLMIHAPSRHQPNYNFVKHKQNEKHIDNIPEIQSDISCLLRKGHTFQTPIGTYTFLVKVIVVH